MCADQLKITAPWNGDILNRRDGQEENDSIRVEVRGKAPVGAAVTVNGSPATCEGENFRGVVSLSDQRNEIRAVARRGGAVWEDTITVLWDRCSRPRYRFSVDDNILFLRDLATRPEDYPSLFDHWYLGFWRRMHEEFGAKVHFNIYYQTVEGDFTLAAMPAKWRGEWEANADWLHLTFHALQDQPARIYKDATYERMARDFDLVVGEIRRFAGEALLSTFTTVHWAEAPRDACRALRDRGIRGLIGLFGRNKSGVCTTGYYLDEALKDHVAARDYWHDPELGLTFVACDAVVNALALDQIEPHLERQGANPHTAELMELLIHEQYFRRELRLYQPDVQDKVVRSLAWVTERGYAPVFWDEGFVGNRG